jgi:hypothetical protein
VLSIYSCIVLFFRLKGKCPTHLSCLRFLSDLKTSYFVRKYRVWYHQVRGQTAVDFKTSRKTSVKLVMKTMALEATTAYDF